MKSSRNGNNMLAIVGVVGIVLIGAICFVVILLL